MRSWWDVKQCMLHQQSGEGAIDVHQYLFLIIEVTGEAQLKERVLKGEESSKATQTNKSATLVNEGSCQGLLLSELMRTEREIPF